MDVDAPARGSARSRPGLDTPLAVALVALALSATFVVLRLASADWDASRFVRAGDRFVDAAQAPPSLFVMKESVGFDGTGFYRLALDPFTRVRDDFGITLDLPAFRHQRILYPLLVRAVAGGDAEATAWALIGVNLAGIAAIGFAGGLLARSAGRHALWGMALPLYPGFALTLGVDTAEIVAAAFALFGLFAIRRERYAQAAALLTIAMLARETTLLISVCGIAVWAWRRMHGERAPSIPLKVFAIPVAAFAAWQLAMLAWWRSLPLSEGTSVDLGVPFRGVIQEVWRWLTPSSTLERFQLFAFVVLAGFVVTVALSVRRSEALTHEKVAFVVGTIAVAMLADSIWYHYWGFMRALTEPYLLGTVVLLARPGAPLHRLAVVAALWLAVCLQLILYP